MKQSYKLNGNRKLYIIPISDLHIGSEQFNSEYFEYCLDKIDDIKGDKRIYLLGDLVEHASKTVGNSAFKTTMPLEDQIELAINLLKPYRKDIVFSCMGNHEARSTKDIDMDINKLNFAKAFKCEYGHQKIDEIKINDNIFNIHVSHGKGSAAYSHLAQGKMIRETQTINADLFIQGHNHRLDFFAQPIRTANGIKRRYYAFSGAFLNYNGYPDAMLLPILPPAFQHITINKDMIVRNNPYYIDVMRPDLKFC
jgi:UDP-2,3-diacylglucosamine pyrophosphatase LpxH